jgi:hypothetical protein
LRDKPTQFWWKLDRQAREDQLGIHIRAALFLEANAVSEHAEARLKRIGCGRS